MNPATYTKTGSKATTAAKLDKAVFGVEADSHELLKQAYLTYLANGRLNLAKTKRRGQVSGGGRKPHPQKGTGRARSGSIRNPIWRGGGIIFGPTGEENYKKKLSLKSKHQALRQALSLAAKEGQVKVIETFECKEGLVKPTISLLNKISARGRILLVVSIRDELVDRASRNISDLKAVQAKYLNVYDILNADTIVISQKALVMINDWLSEPKLSAKVKTNE